MNTANTTHYSNLLQTPGVITSEDVLRLRREVFQDGFVNQAEAEAVFALNDSIEEACREWSDFFIEAMSIFVVDQAEPRGYVSIQNANWLMHAISNDGVIKSATELELLVKILAKSTSSPQTLIQFALLQVSLAVVEGEGPLKCGTLLQKGAIGEAEVELLRTILYAAGGDNSLTISKQEAEILVQLNDQTSGADNHPSWQHLFVGATANYLMAACGGKAPSREEALAREEWLNDIEVDVGGFMKDVTSGFGQMFSSSFFDDVFTSSHRQMEKAWKKRNDAFEASMNQAEAIDSSEAKWLVDRINRDGEIDTNEKALLKFIKEESGSIDPALQALFHKVA